MSSKRAVEPANTTLPFERFWAWLQVHPNCVLRAGTPDTFLFDDEDLHWHFAIEDPETFLVQLIRGKRLMAELLINPTEVSYVQAAPSEAPEEFLFELVSEAERDRVVAYHFVMSHGYDDEPAASPGGGRWTH